MADNLLNDTKEKLTNNRVAVIVVLGFIIIASVVSVANEIKTLFISDRPAENTEVRQPTPPHNNANEIIVSMPLSKYEADLKKQQEEIERLRHSNANDKEQVARLTKALEINKNDQANLVKSHEESVHYYQDLLHQYESLAGTVPDAKLQRQKNQVTDRLEPYNPALSEYNAYKNATTYPLVGLDGKLVKVKLENLNTGEERTQGIYESPKEVTVTGLNYRHFYRVTILEYDSDNERWITIAQCINAGSPNL